jgi:hypothetical protein
MQYYLKFKHPLKVNERDIKRVFKDTEYLDSMPSSSKEEKLSSIRNKRIDKRTLS